MAYDSQSKHCPVCTNVALQRMMVAGVEVCACQRCGGAWYESDAFERLMNVASKDLRPADTSCVTHRACPVDHQPMPRMKYPQTLVEVEVCPSCYGLWLDKGETREIRKVRDHLYRAGKLERYAPIPGLKGRLIRNINRLIDRLADYSD